MNGQSERTLADRTVLLTGATSDIGASYLWALAGAGARVVATDLASLTAAGESLVAAVTANGPGSAVFCACDVSDSSDVERSVKCALDEFGSLDSVINNAAMYKALGHKRLLTELSDDDWDNVLRVNVRGTWQVIKGSAPALAASGDGRIVNISSVVARNGAPGFAHYVASKAAVEGLTRAAARELGGQGTTVNAVSPGLVDDAATRAINSDEYLETASHSRALSRSMTPRDLVGAVLWLAGGDSGFVTGQVLIVDGGGGVRMSLSGEPELVNPATLEPLPAVPPATEDDVDAAVGRSAAAFEGPWRRDHRQRAAVLQRWADLLDADQRGLIDDLVAQTGKPISEAAIEIAGAVDALRFNGGLARLPLGRTATLHDGSEAHLVRQPIGPTVFISPWNWPVLLLLRDLGPALAAGVTALIKPAPQTTTITDRVVALGHRAGVPVDALIRVAGGADVGSSLVRHPGTRAVAITGSTTAGQAVLRDAAETMTRPLLELGGKASMLILPDAQAAAALTSAAKAAVITSGQMCMACTRVLVPDWMKEYALQMLSGLLRAKRVGDPREQTTSLGPMISEQAMEKVSGYVDIARRSAKLVTGGDSVHPDGLPGHFLTPALVTDVEKDSPLVQHDIFGPVLTLEIYSGEDAGLDLANATPFGLAAAVWTQNLSRGLSLAREINAGTVWVNGYNRSYAEMPSGGVNMSGLGRTRGIEGLEQFTELKHIHFSLADSS